MAEKLIENLNAIALKVWIEYLISSHVKTLSKRISIISSEINSENPNKNVIKLNTDKLSSDIYDLNTRLMAMVNQLCDETGLDVRESSSCSILGAIVRDSRAIKKRKHKDGKRTD